MPAIPVVTKSGPRSYVPAVGTVVTAGTFVEGTAGGRIRTAGAGSTRQEHSLTVRMPAGVEDGQRVRVPGRGGHPAAVCGRSWDSGTSS